MGAVAGLLAGVGLLLIWLACSSDPPQWRSRREWDNLDQSKFIEDDSRFLCPLVRSILRVKSTASRDRPLCRRAAGGPVGDTGGYGDRGASEVSFYDAPSCPCPRLGQAERAMLRCP
ncbi:hypothetical protein BKH04_00560 [Actinomyces naeslundii]|nr:hypothetical protein BKH04_00560 [Actinomyces naeslundii]